MADGIKESWEKTEPQLPHIYTSPLHLPLGSTIEGITFGNNPVFTVVDIRNTPPILGAGDAGTKYIVGDTPTGVFIGKEKYIANWTGTAYEFIETFDGWMAYLSSDVYNTYYVRRIDISTDEWIPLSEIIGLDFAGQSILTKYISADNGSNDNDGSLWSPYATIQYAIDEMGAADIISIVVDQSVYEGTVNLVANKTISITAIPGQYSFAGIGAVNIPTGCWFIANNLDILGINCNTEANYITLENGSIFDFTNQSLTEIQLFGTLLPHAEFSNIISVSAFVQGYGVDVSSGNILTLSPTSDYHAITQKYFQDEVTIEINSHASDENAHHDKLHTINDTSVHNGIPAGVLDNVMTLDSNGLPKDSGFNISLVTGDMTMKGGWDASGGSYPASPENGDKWIITTAGTMGGIDYLIGDMTIYSVDQLAWFKVDNTDLVSSVFGRVGPVVAAAGDYTAGQIDVVTTSFDHTLSSAEDTVQKALDKIDDAIIIPVQSDSTVLIGRFQMRTQLAYVNGGNTLNLNTAMPDLTSGAAPTITITLINRGTYADTTIYVADSKLVWDTDHWNLDIRVNKLYYDTSTMVIEEAATNDVDLHIVAEGY